jgi:hypothetical protein
LNHNKKFDLKIESLNMLKPVHYERLNHDFQPDPSGRLFFDGKSFCDLSGLNILRCGVDTVRQLYKGSIRSGVLDLFNTDDTVFFGGHEWHAGRIGRDSGYQFKLQNSDLGIILLIKNFNIKPEVEGAHLKIEVSPHLIEDTHPGVLQGMLDDLADLVLEKQKYNQSAVHIAIDVQGWEPPADLVARMHCRSRVVRQFDTIEAVDFDSLAVTYGRGETYMFGSPSSMQLCIYNKTKQAKATDKLDFWEHVWRKTDNPFEDSPCNYNPDVPVWRIELRFHHSVVEQFAAGTKFKGTDIPCYFRSYHALTQHLDGLLKYGFDSFKFLQSPSRFHPVWTIFMQDVTVKVPVPSFLDKTDYKRYYKTSTGFSGKNIDLLIGNAVSLAARSGLNAHQTIRALKTLPFWPTIEVFYRQKGMHMSDINKFITKALRDRVIRWGKAI